MNIYIPRHVDDVFNLTNKRFLGVLHLGTPKGTPCCRAPRFVLSRFSLQYTSFEFLNNCVFPLTCHYFSNIFDRMRA